MLDDYRLYDGIGMIPEEFQTFAVGNTTREMCRRLCSEMIDQSCSGFLYNRHEQMCQLSTYSGEWVTADGRNHDSASGFEFYRRKRHVGQIAFLSAFYFHCYYRVTPKSKSINASIMPVLTFCRRPHFGPQR